MIAAIQSYDVVRSHDAGAVLRRDGPRRARALDRCSKAAAGEIVDQVTVAAGGYVSECHFGLAPGKAHRVVGEVDA